MNAATPMLPPRRGAPSSLRGRLRDLREQRAALNALFAQAREFSVARPAGVWRLRLQRATRQPTSWTLLGAPDGVVRLAFESESSAADIGMRAWHEYEGESRLLAWTMAFEDLLDVLTAAWCGSLRPDGFVHNAAANDLVLNLALVAPDGIAHHAWIALDANALLRIAQIAGWTALPGGRAEEWASLVRSVALVLGAVEMTAADIDECVPGDVLVLGPRAVALRSLALAAPGLGCWRAEWRDGHVHLGAAIADQPKFSPQQPESEAMNVPADPARAASPIDRVPVHLQFEIGETRLSFAELQKLQPGYVLELQGSIDQASVIVRANGRVVGRGELVSVGDTLGVQILQWGPPLPPEPGPAEVEAVEDGGAEARNGLQ